MKTLTADYYVYIATNESRSFFDVCITCNLKLCTEQVAHKQNSLAYWEGYNDARTAMKRELELKKLSKRKKQELILNTNLHS